MSTSEVQETVNLLFEVHPESCKEFLLDHFTQSHGKYPQYNGYFDGGHLVRMRKNWYKGIYYFRKGDIALIKNKVRESITPNDEYQWTAYCPTTESNVALRKDHFVEVN